MGEPAAVPLLTAMLLFFAPLVLPFANGEARTDEREADEYALRIAHDPSSYLSVMEKLRRMNLEERRPGLISRVFFDTHPSYLERIRLGRAHYRRQQSNPPGRRARPNRRATASATTYAAPPPRGAPRRSEDGGRPAGVSPGVG